jgi:quercetin dioxygenase-like cupin family protein
MTNTELTPQADEKPSTEQMRGKILALESAMLAMPQIDLPIDHFFAPGLYLRQMTMPKDAIVTGKIHKTEHLCILAKGKVSVATENGTVTHTAPTVIHSTPGTKRALHALEDSVWINCHHNPTDERDTDKIDDIFVTDTYEKFLNFMEQKQLQGGA